MTVGERLVVVLFLAFGVCIIVGVLAAFLIAYPLITSLAVIALTVATLVVYAVLDRAERNDR